MVSESGSREAVSESEHRLKIEAVPDLENIHVHDISYRRLSSLADYSNCIIIGAVFIEPALLVCVLVIKDLYPIFICKQEIRTRKNSIASNSLSQIIDLSGEKVCTSH